LAVLDQRCRLCGLDRLRVVAASVLPAVPRAVPNMAIMMIAERLAHWIQLERRTRSNIDAVG